MSDDMRAYLLTLSSEERQTIIAWLRDQARALGVPLPDEQAPRKPRRCPPAVEEETEPVNPEQIPHRSQKRIDATAASLLEDIDM